MSVKLPEHSEFAFSASPRWIPCPGSMSYPENRAQDTDAGEYADEGTAAHTLGSDCLKSKTDAIDHLGRVIKVGKREFTVTDEFADHVQTYIDDVRRRSIGAFLMVEQRVTMAGVEGFDETNYGTSDGVIAVPAKEEMSILVRKQRLAADERDKYQRYAFGVVEDLKFGMGERVYAWTPATEESLFTMTMFQGEDEKIEVEPNFQLMMYALAALADIQLLVEDPVGILIVINQPRLGSLSELWVPIAVLERFALFAADALVRATTARDMGAEKVEAAWLEDGSFLNPGQKQCRWCRVVCPARTAKVQEETASEFDVIAETPPVVLGTPEAIAKALLAVQFVAEWCNAVMVKANELVSTGTEIIGPDEKPYKIVEGKQGKNKWKNPKAAEEALLANLDREKVYVEKMITAPVAKKMLNKKATKATWTDVFEPLIGRAPGKPVLALGSDPRPPYSPSSEADEFEVEDEE